MMGGLDGPHYEPTGTEQVAARSMLEGQLKASARELAGSGVGKDKDKKAPPASAPEGDAASQTQERAPATPQEAAAQSGAAKAEGKKMAGGALGKLDRFIQKLPSASVEDGALVIKPIGAPVNVAIEAAVAPSLAVSTPTNKPGVTAALKGSLKDFTPSLNEATIGYRGENSTSKLGISHGDQGEIIGAGVDRNLGDGARGNISASRAESGTYTVSTGLNFSPRDNLTITGEYNPDGSKKITGSSSIDFSGTRLSLGASGGEVAGEQNYALSTQAATKLGTFGLSLGNTAGDLSSSLRASMRTFAGGNLTANINLLDLGQSQVAIEQPLGRFNAKVSMAQAEGGAGAIYTAGVGGELGAGVQANLSASRGPSGDLSGTVGIRGSF